ncbi:MAG: hypothetical protein RL077_3381 [Verrucomicrobiota bacterium]
MNADGPILGGGEKRPERDDLALKNPDLERIDGAEIGDGGGEEVRPQRMKRGVAEAEFFRFDVAPMCGEHWIGPSERGEFGEQSVVVLGRGRVGLDPRAKIVGEVGHHRGG